MQCLSTVFAYLKNCCDSKNRNSRPELEKFDNKIYIEASGDVACLVEAEPCCFMRVVFRVDSVCR